MVELPYDNNSQATIQMESYEGLYHRKCISLLYWEEVEENKVIGPKVLHGIKDQVLIMRERMKMVQS